MADEGFDLLPTDAFVDILVRLPTSSRRRFRLVCKRWRDTIDKRTPERQVRTKILAFNFKSGGSRALVFDDQDGRLRHEWTYASALSGRVDMVGTSNGLICLVDSGEGDRAAVTVANPITGEALALPSSPWRPDSPSDLRYGIYGFGYHPTTGQYKVVHVQSRLVSPHDAVHVLTLGGGSAWREVVASPAIGGSFNSFCAGVVVVVDGSAYWFTSAADRVMALDLNDERITNFPGPPGVRPVCREPEASWKLTSVNARLGVVFKRYYEEAATRVEVWVLEGGGGEEQPRWSRRYSLMDRFAIESERSWIVMTPHLTHGEYILSTSRDSRRLYRRKVGECTDVVDDGMAVKLLPPVGEEPIMTEEEETWGSLRTFAYVETREPLPIECLVDDRRWSSPRIGGREGRRLASCWPWPGAACRRPLQEQGHASRNDDFTVARDLLLLLR